MAVSQTLLSQIANPQVADIPGSVARGRQFSQQRQLGQQQQDINTANLNLLQQQAAAGERGAKAETSDQLNKELVLDVFSAFSVGPGQSRNNILQNALRKAPANSSASIALKNTLDAPEGKERDKKLLMILNQAKQTGLLPDIQTRQTPGQVEREVSLAERKQTLEEQKFGAGVTGAARVGAQEILEDGTIIQSTQKGPVVFNSLGERVEGEAARSAIERARAEKVSNLRKSAGAKKTATLEAENELKAQVEAKVVSAKEAAKISVKAFERLQKIETGINNITEAINLIDQGAETGAIASKLPSIRAASVKLDNLQGRLGLDVIGNTTFGALSESELRFALDTALPQKLEGPELKNWLIEKRSAQEKLSDYVESAAIFLGTPGNTVKDWVVKRKENRAAAAPAAATTPGTTPAPSTQVLNFDAQGNLI